MPEALTREEAGVDGRRPARRGCAVHGLGAALPEQVVSNEPLAESLGVDLHWIVKRLGIRSRHELADDETLTDLAAEAAKRALDDAGVDASQVDLVIGATTTSDELLPNLGPLVAARIGADRAWGFDLGAACSGFLYGLFVGSGLVEAGRSDTVVVIGADQYARFTDPTDRRTAPLFGDGAGAVVLCPAEEGRFGDFRFHAAATAENEGLTAMRRATGKIYMEGLATYRFAVDALSKTTTELLEENGLGIGDIDLFVYHQANARIIRAVGEKLGLEKRQVAEYLAETGNTSAASIPLALAGAAREGRLNPGSRLVVGAIGSGFVWGAGLLEWGRPGENASPPVQ